MRYSDLARIKKIKKMLEYIAYGSLALDVGIAIVTLVSVHYYAKEISTILTFLNYGLTAVVLVSLILFLALLFLSHYEKIIEKFADLGFRLKNAKERKKQ
ncbi:MAG: hypothetical protein ACP5P2_01775 [Candidatus Micrarchaeia archaeon]|jgi:hypothetical protein